MIIITGAAGFIGSGLTAHFNQQNRTDLILVDDFTNYDKRKNLLNKHYLGWVHRSAFLSWIHSNYQNVEMIFHLGARTDTTDFSTEIFDRLNLHYSQEIWNICSTYQIPLVYASSAATYGKGEQGYKDSHQLPQTLHPLNPYAVSKNEFDKWALGQEKSPPVWYGLKFFNVYGPNEYHKKRMASVVFHAFNQIQQTGKVKLFKSHRPDFEDGKQLRDFIYVKDITNVCYWLYRYKLPASGLYNLGIGSARTFIDLAHAVFSAMNLNPNIEFMDMPADIRESYQYFTEADMTKLLHAGYYTPFTTLEEGITNYVQQYLIHGEYW